MTLLFNWTVITLQTVDCFPLTARTGCIALLIPYSIYFSTENDILLSPEDFTICLLTKTKHSTDTGDFFLIY